VSLQAGRRSRTHRRSLAEFTRPVDGDHHDQKDMPGVNFLRRDHVSEMVFTSEADWSRPRLAGPHERQMIRIVPAAFLAAAVIRRPGVTPTVVSTGGRSARRGFAWRRSLFAAEAAHRNVGLDMAFRAEQLALRLACSWHSSEDWHVARDRYCADDGPACTAAVSRAPALRSNRPPISMAAPQTRKPRSQ
jgi:hypothetical protein